MIGRSVGRRVPALDQTRGGVVYLAKEAPWKPKPKD